MKIAKGIAGINYFSGLTFAPHKLRDARPASLDTTPDVTTAEFSRPLDAIKRLVGPLTRHVHIRSH